MYSHARHVVNNPALLRTVLVVFLLVLAGSKGAMTNSSGSSEPESEMSSAFAHALISPGPSAQLPKTAAAVFDWLIGDWQVDVYDIEPGGAKHISKGEWHFQWVLEGRAVQDVWIVPTRLNRSVNAPGEHNRYGTSLRIYDPKIDAWHVLWFNPVTQDRTELTARKVGNIVVQQGIDEDGSYVRWTFQNITATSFTWRGELSRDGGKTWQLDGEFVARRIGNQAPSSAWR